MKFFKKLIACSTTFLLMVFNPSLHAQNDVQVVTQVLPPYSPYFSDYISYENRLVIQLINTVDASGGGITRDVRLTATITGDNGVSLVLPPTFIPPVPISLPPMGVTRLTGIQLQDYWDINAWNVSGISASEIILGNGLPEGNYELCIRVLDYSSGTPLSLPAPSGCSFFNINSIEPPILLQPSCGVTLDSNTPQNILFSWAVPAGTNPSQVEYELAIIELFNNMDPNQAFLSFGNTPFFQKTVPINVYNYTLSDPPLEPGRTYAYRVTAVNKLGNPRPLNFRNGGSSEVCTFTYGKSPEINITSTTPQNTDVAITQINIDGDDVLANPQNQNTPPDPDDSPNCISDCIQSVPQNTTLISNLSPGEEVGLGKFLMEIIQAQHNGNDFSGTGKIYINFLQIPILVTFNNLKVNTDKIVYAGAAYAKAEPGLPNNLEFLTKQLQMPQVSEAVFENAITYIENEGRKVHLLSGQNQAFGVPISWENGANTLTFFGMIFTPEKAHINLATGFEVYPSNNENNHVLLTGSNCLRPNGFGSTGELQLQNTVSIPISNALTHTFKPETSVGYDCSGISNIHLKGTLTFGRNIALPLNEQGNVIEGNVTADYETDITNFHDWTLEIPKLSHPFTIPGLVGFSLDANAIIIDQSLSTTPNPINKDAFWKGVYAENISVQFPEFFQINDTPIEKEVSHFILDKNGVSGKIGPFNNLISINEGAVGGWPISVDTFSIILEDSNLDGAEITGNVKLPIADTELGYEVLFTLGENPEDGFDMKFDIVTQEAYAVPMWFAQLHLEKGSEVNIIKEGNTWKPSANLHGGIEIDWGVNNTPDDSLVSSFQLPEVNFTNLTITPGQNNIPDINFGELGITNAQATIADFSFDLNDIKVINEPNGDLGLTLDIFVHLDEGDFSVGGSTAFTIWGAYKNKKYIYKKTKLNRISLTDVDINIATINGNLYLFEKDEVYGNGFKGDFDVKLNQMDMNFAALMQFGSIKTQQENYRYFYTDSYLKIGGSGIPIPPTPFAVYGGSGGFWVNMNLANEPDSNAPHKTIDQLKLDKEMNDDLAISLPAGNTRFEEDKKIPAQGGIGFSQSIIVGVNSAETLFNADLGFLMDFNLNGSLKGEMKMFGDGYIVQELDGNRGSAFIKGDVDLTIGYLGEEEKNNIFFDNTSTVTIDLLDGLVTGQGTLHLYADKDTWFHKLGYWQKQYQDFPWQDKKRVHLSLGEFEGLDTQVNNNNLDTGLYSYFMFGPDIPGLPEMPLDVRNNNPKNWEMNNERYQVFTGPNSSSGVALGSGLHLDTDLDFLIFYLKAKHISGFDFTLRDETGLCAGDFGLNGWYARGQAYGYFKGEAGVKLDLWVWKGEAKLMELEAVAALQAGLPNPIYLNGNVNVNGQVLEGLLDFNVDFEVELGEECKNPTSGPFDEYPIIAEVLPEDQEEDVDILRQMEVSFNFPNGPFEYTELDKKGKKVTREFQYNVDYFTLEWFDEESNTNKSKDFFPAYREDGYSATFTDLDFYFPPKTTFTYSIGVTGYELVDGEKEERVKETKIGTFTTGAFPTKITKESIWFSTPFIGENYFIPTNFPKGYITLPVVLPHWTDPNFWYVDAFKLGNTYQGPMASGTFEFIARFIDVKSKDYYDIPYQINNADAQGVYGGKLVFDFPQRLETGKIYELQLMVIYTPSINNYVATSNSEDTYKNVLLGGSGQQNGGNNNGQGYQVLQANLNFNNNNILNANFVTPKPKPNLVFQNSLANANSGNQNLAIKRKHRALLGATKTSNKVEWPIFEGFKFHFKTSKYKSLSQKMGNITYETTKVEQFPSNVANITDNSLKPLTINLPIIVLECDENFDEKTLFPEKETKIGFLNNKLTVLSFQKPPLIELAKQATFTGTSIQWGVGNQQYPELRNNFWKAYPGYNATALKTNYHVPQNQSDWALVLETNDYTYPSEDYWSQLLPSRTNNSIWGANRYFDNALYEPFNDRHYPNVDDVLSLKKEEPLLALYAGNYTIKNIYHQGKKVGFTTTPLNYSPPNNNNGGMWIQNNQWQNQNPPSKNAFFAVVDYTEWLAIQDWHRFKRHLYRINNEEIQFNDVQADYDSNMQFLEVREGVSEWILEKMPYWQHRRTSGSPSFKIKKYGGGATIERTYTVPADLNKNIN
ncbi:hypothetical protein [Aquimarina spongiae]|uniref:Fibronectin type-III domain-containing protein n=1 Tax=Aquimarina spongiae TaxID=570521 RepID=A0A1M6DTE8_9FLAO|nr:hypothetical protein [Aquimarina spongiae]SHI76443.1 hypothetical protein SAMN04488508_1036 [Aquimarina spongiae]